ncbi:MAG: hypothetical protein R3C49_04535 [Planctomycetaceae bacterium]
MQTATDELDETDGSFTVHVVSIDAGSVVATDTGAGTIHNVTVLIIDDGDPGNHSGNWTQITGAGKEHLDDFELASPNGGPDWATWTFDLEAPGQYEVSVSYREWTNQAAAAPYTVYDSGANLGTVAINQTVAANDIYDQGTWFENLGTFNIYSNQLSVTLSDIADGYLSGCRSGEVCGTVVRRTGDSG